MEAPSCLSRCSHAGLFAPLFFLINAHDKWVWKGGQPAPGILHFSRGNRRSWIHETIMHHLNIFPSNWILQKGGWPGPSFLLIRGGGLTLHPSADGVVPQPPGGARGGSVCLAYQRVAGSTRSSWEHLGFGKPWPPAAVRPNLRFLVCQMESPIPSLSGRETNLKFFCLHSRNREGLS